MTSKLDLSRLSNQVGTPGDVTANDAGLDALGTLEWLEQELRTKSAKVNTPVAPTVIKAGVDQPMPQAGESLSSGNSIRHLVFELRSQRYALPVANLVEVSRPMNITPSNGSPDWLLGHSTLRGENIAMVDMRRFLGLGGKDRRPGALLVVRSLREGSQIGLVVDEIREITSVPENAELTEPFALGSTFPFLQVIQRGAQALTVVDPEQLLLSSPIHTFASPAGLTPRAMEPKTIPGESGIEERLADTTKHVRRTAERSKEMTAMVQAIGDIAEQTRLLAMNGSIKAAAAGEAGQDFALIAGEVERLADRCAYSSKQLLAVVESVESEIAVAASGLDAAARHINTLSQSAMRADGCLSEIEGVSSTFISLVKSISQAAEAQARGSEIAARAIDDMLNNLRHMERSAAEAEQAAGSFKTLTADLKSSVRMIQGKHNH